jgi:hypothetical protein
MKPNFSTFFLWFDRLLKVMGPRLKLIEFSIL